jgi:hypothetical protein
MSEDHPERLNEADAELQREIRAERKFTLTEAIGRMAGPGAMKGESPVSGMQQAVAVIQEYLNSRLGSTATPLSGVLFRWVKESELLLRGYNQPLVVLAELVRKVLHSEYLLKELVRQADVEWGRMNDERPYFEEEGRPPHPDDPYTHESVRTALTGLAETLAGDNPS